MRTSPLPFIGGFYADDTRPFSMQDVVNWLPTVAEVEGTRTSVMAQTAPGLSPFVDTGGTLPTRNVYSAEGRLFATMGQSFYQISNTGVAIPRGTVTGVKRVRAAHNQITNGNQIMLVNGDAGFLYQTTDQSFVTITDDGFPGAIDVLFKDGYFIIIEPGRRFAQNSDLADGLSWNTLDRFTSEVTPDALVALASTQNDLILFSESSAEFFENTGAAQQPYRSKRISMERGCASRYGVVHLDNTVFWLGDNGKFYVLDGYGARRISTKPIEQAILGLNWASAFGFAWGEPGRDVAYWTFPDGQTWGYDVSQPPGFQWHRRDSLGLERWRVNGTAYWQNRWIAADFQRGRLWELDRDYPLEGADEMASEMTGPVIHDHQNAVQMPRLEFIFDTGQPEVEVRTFEPQPDPPTITGEAPDGEAGVVYGPFAYTVTPGGAPIATVVVKSGELPEGLTLSNAGVLSGTPAHSGSFTITLRVTDTNGLWDEHTDTFVVTIVTTLLADPAVLPTSVSVMAFDPTSTYLAVGHYDAPYLIIYKRVGDVFTALSLPSMPSLLDRPHGLAWSPNGLHLAIAPEGPSAGSPAFVMKHADDVFTVIGDLPGTPLDWTQERGIAYTADGAFLTLAFSGGLKTWSRSGDTYSEATTKATSAEPATFQTLDYSADGAWLAVGLIAAPWLDLFQVNGALLTLDAPPPGVLAGFCVQPRFNSDSTELGFATQTASPYLSVYTIDGEDFTALTVPTVPTATPEAFEWSPSGRNFLVGGGGSNATYVYARTDDTVALVDTLTGLVSPRAITWAPNGTHFVLGGGGLRFYRVEGD